MDMLKKQKVVTAAFECRYNEIITSYAMVNLQNLMTVQYVYWKYMSNALTVTNKKTCFKSVVCLL